MLSAKEMREKQEKYNSETLKEELKTIEDELAYALRNGKSCVILETLNVQNIKNLKA